MAHLFKINCLHLIAFSIVYFELGCNAEMQLEATVDQVLDAARQAVTSVVDTAQGVVNGAIDTAKNTVIGEINVVQDVAKLAIQTGRGAVEIGGNYVVGLLNATG
ncbi:hypothetical protein TKK_0015806 [Trichogramma kaykai]|uniref:Uncharacterized protein n=1 Tax=Trichogramma kaykai TaxID=54128 RepID=A0ABD2W7Z5_9HYME